MWSDKVKLYRIYTDYTIKEIDNYDELKWNNITTPPTDMLQVFEDIELENIKTAIFIARKVALKIFCY